MRLRSSNQAPGPWCTCQMHELNLSLKICYLNAIPLSHVAEKENSSASKSTKKKLVYTVLLARLKEAICA